MKERRNGVKKKRVCSEWRKARSRLAARSRRERECELFGELSRGLPMPQPMVAHLDKASIIRITLSYLRLRALLIPPHCAVNTPHCTLETARPVILQSGTAAQGCESDGMSRVEMVLDSALEGFLLLLSRDGQVIYTTEAISMQMGIKQVDLIGQSLYDFMHPCDQQEAREILSSKSVMEQKYDLFFRMRCSLTPQRQNVNLKSTTWKVMHCTGVRKPSVPGGTGCLVLLCQSLPVPKSGAWDTNLNCSAFLSKHSPDMRFTYCQPRVFQLTGYTETDLLGHSVYQYCHASDCQHVHKAHLSLFSKGQTSTGKYRLLVKHGGYVWVETIATVVYNSRTGQLQSVICINYILSEVEHSGVIFSLKQMECLLKPFSSSPNPALPLLLPDPAQLDELSQKAAVPTDPCDNVTSGESTWTRGYEGHLNGMAEKDAFATHYDTDQRSEVVPEIEMLLAWSTEGQMQPSPQDLETLAPYIPMDGEDFLLSPLSDVEEAELKGEVPRSALPLTFPCMEGQSHANSFSLLRNTWARLTPPMSSQSPLSYCSPASAHQGRMPMREHGGDSGRGCMQRSGLGWGQALKRYGANMHLSPGPHPQCCAPSWPPQHVTSSLKKQKKADLSHNTNCTSYWLNPDGSVCRCESVPWAPGHTDISIITRNQHRPCRDPHRTVLLRCASVLPVLSRWECEVNAPLDPSSCLLRGSEILSVLDQATSRLPP